MLQLFVATLCVSIVAGKHVSEKEYMFLDENTEELVWPIRYTVKALKMSFSSDLTEDMVAWKTNSSSRVDYNEGAVKLIALLDVEDYEDDDDDDANEDDDDDDDDYYSDVEGKKYEIHPETSRFNAVKVVCNDISSSSWDQVELDDILPSLSNKYKLVGNEIIIDIETAKFEFSGMGDSGPVKKTIWAFNTTDFDDQTVWTPVKYEITEYNEVLGSISKHEVWYFSEFSTEFDDDVFDVTQYNCPNESVSHTIHSEAVTKELMFINPENKKHVKHVFNSFKAKYQPKYKSESEHQMRQMIFQQKMRLIRSINRKNLTYKLGINQFADRTHEEIILKHTGLKQRAPGKKGTVPFPYTKTELADVVEELPKEHDLRLLGYVSPVKNQQSCGSCWTYGTTAAVEGALARINGGRVLSLSNQALVDCAWAYGAYGCDGGSDNAAYEWMMKYGLPTVEDYGNYKNKDGVCHIQNMTTYPIKGYTDVTPFNANALKVAVVKHGPLSVSVEVTGQFSMYSRGIYYENGCGPSALNHEVTLVGYGDDDGELFWVLKNSWGVEWGEAGYMSILAKDNNCGVATEPTYVVF